jgi:hypothetical protein
MNRLLLLILSISFINFKLSHAQFTNVMIDNAFSPEEPSITINLLNPDLIAAGSNVQNAYYSTDGGATWFTTLFNSSLSNAGDPCLVSDSLGSIFYFHLVNSVDKVVCQKSDDGGVTYTDGSFAWSNSGLFEDKEWAAVDPHTNNVYVSWTEYDNGFSPGPQDSSRIFFSRSTDQGQTFTNGIKINEISGDCLYLDITDPHPFVGPGGEVYVTFMDSSGIRFNKSTDFGNTWLSTPPLIDAGGAYRYNPVPGVTRIRTMPYSACDRSNSPYNGNLYVSWADQRNGTNNSDIFFAKSNDGGNSWTSALKINADSSGRHQFRNAMAVDQTNGYIYIVYYDRRNYPNNDSTDVYLSKSTDGGDHWIDYKINSNGFYSDGSVFDGDYIDIAAHAGIVRPIWTAIDNFSSGIWTCLFNEPTVGIQNIFTDNKIDFTVNPNPADVVAVISFSNTVENTKCTITDASGRILKTFSVNHETEKIIDVSDFSAGIYFIKAGNATRKLIIER